MKHIVFIVCVLLLFSFVIFSKDAEPDVLRIRVVGESDSELHQRQKVKVWEAVEKEIEKEDFKSLDEAKLWAVENVQRIKEISQETLKDAGSGASANVFVREEYYDKEFFYPAGFYESVVVELGDARGHNVWSLIFPDVALSISAGKVSDGFLIVRRDAVLSVGFKSIQIFREIFKDL